jgi:hypothetical protein
MSESSLTEAAYISGIEQLQRALENKCFSKAEAGIHVVGTMVLQSFRHDRDNFVNELADTLNSVCQSKAVRFKASLALGPSAFQVLNSFATDRGVGLISAGWLELVDNEERQMDKRLIGVFRLPNGRKGVGIFQVLQ